MFIIEEVHNSEGNRIVKVKDILKSKEPEVVTIGMKNAYLNQLAF